ncbi:MAG: carboxylate--amine ligase [Methanosphaera sp. SHI613]|jgi:carbamoylphosphate synthase large subunit|nr:MAG: carboxylate--amine ligase [Methanosphaera sp. SHI613]
MKILFIGSRLFDDVSWYTKKEGITTILTESNENAINLDLADKHYIVERGMEGPREVAIKEDVDAVIPLIGIDKPLVDVGSLKDTLEAENGIPVIAAGYESAKLAADKYHTKQILTENNIKTPSFKKVDSKYNIEDVKKDLPIVLKTPEGQGGSGVKIALTADDVEEFIKDNDEVFSEEYVEGFEASIEVLRWKNKEVALTPIYKGLTTTKGTHPLAKIKQGPLNINGLDNDKHNNALRQLAVKLSKLANVEGTMDIDILHDNNSDEDYIIELNTRPSGTRYMTAATTDIYPLCQLVDMASGKWDNKKVENQIKNYYSAELPIGNFPEDKKIPENKIFDGDVSYVVHGPKNYQRLTARASTRKNLNDLVYELVPGYAKENKIEFE